MSSFRYFKQGQYPAQFTQSVKMNHYFALANRATIQSDSQVTSWLASRCEEKCVAALAFGSYGRRHLSPNSDRDLLIVGCRRQVESLTSDNHFLLDSVSIMSVAVEVLETIGDNTAKTSTLHRMATSRFVFGNPAIHQTYVINWQDRLRTIDLSELIDMILDDARQRAIDTSQLPTESIDLKRGLGGTVDIESFLVLKAWAQTNSFRVYEFLKKRESLYAFAMKKLFSIKFAQEESVRRLIEQRKQHSDRYSVRGYCPLFFELSPIYEQLRWNFSMHMQTLKCLSSSNKWKPYA